MDSSGVSKSVLTVNWTMTLWQEGVGSHDTVPSMEHLGHLLDERVLLPKSYRGGLLISEGVCVAANGHGYAIQLLQSYFNVS